MSLAAIGCSDDKKDGAKSTEKVYGDGTANWTMQGWDIGSTFHNKNEKKLTKDNVKDLEPIWEVVHPAAGTPAIVDGVVYVTASTFTAAYDLKTGNQLWKTGERTEPPTLGTTASPAVVDGHVYFATAGGGYMVSLNAETGALEWSTQFETHAAASGYSSVIPVGDTLVVGSGSSEEAFAAADATFQGAVVAFDRATGAQKWKTPTTTGNENGCAVWGSVAVDKDSGHVFAGTGNNYTGDPGPGSDAVFSFELDGGAERWRKQVTEGDVFTILAPKSPDTDFGANVVVYEFNDKKIVAAGQKSGDMYLFDRESGTIIAERNLNTTGRPGSALTGGVFQALTFDGERLLVVSNLAASEGPGSVPGNSALFALDPESLNVIWERQLAATVWNPITTANGVAFVGIGKVLQAFANDTGEILKEWEFAGTISGGAAISNGYVCVQSGLAYISGIRDDKFRCLGTEGGGGPINGGDNKPTFTNVYEKVIVGGRCADGVCHSSGASAGNLNLAGKQQAYDALVGVAASGTTEGGGGCADKGKTRVVRNDPAASLLVEKLSGTVSCGEPMPPASEPLDAALQTLVKDWIAAGAPND